MVVTTHIVRKTTIPYTSISPLLLIFLCSHENGRGGAGKWIENTDLYPYALISAKNRARIQAWGNLSGTFNEQSRPVSQSKKRNSGRIIV
jgi:hypothetical protein